MTTHDPIPPLRDLPAGRLADRKQHLLAEIHHARGSRWRLMPIAHFRLAAAATAVCAVAVVGFVSFSGGAPGPTRQHLASLSRYQSAARHFTSYRFAGRSADATVAEIEQTWRTMLDEGTSADSAMRFPNLSSEAFSQALDNASHAYNFEVVKVEILHPDQSAPLVVVRTDDSAALSRSAGAILHQIDPKAATNDDRTGWAYEGFFFKALDASGKPFLVVFNSWRGPHAGGGQWASDRSLLPFQTLGKLYSHP